MPLVRYVKTVRHAELYQTTGSNPSRFDCNDGRSYIVKDSHGGRRRRHLINEWLGADIASLAGIGIAPCAVVEIHPDSVPDDIPFPYFRPSGFGFGSEMLRGTKNINDVEFQHIRRYDDSLLRQFCTLVLFDIWLYNNDRTANNTNALFQETPSGIRLIAIDHAALFEDYDYQTLTQPTVKDNAPTLEDTLLYMTFVADLIRKNPLNARMQAEECIRGVEALPESVLAECIGNIPPEFSVKPGEYDYILEYILHRQFLVRQWFSDLIRLILQ